MLSAVKVSCNWTADLDARQCNQFMTVPVVERMGRVRSRGKVWGREGHSPVRAVAGKGNQQLIAVSRPFSYVICSPPSCWGLPALLFCTCSECCKPQLSQRRQRYRPVAVWRRHTHSELFFSRPLVMTFMQCLYMYLWPWKVFKRNCSCCIHNRHTTAVHLLGIDVCIGYNHFHLPWPLCLA